MTRMVLVLTACMLLAASMVGCKKAEAVATATEQVMQLDMAHMVETAQLASAPQGGTADDAATENAEYISLPLGQKLQIPTVYTADLTSADGKAQLIADAEILIPDTESMPIARTAKADFQLSELNLLIEGLFGDAPLYWNDGLMPKAEVQALYEHYQEHLEVNGKQLTAVQRENVKTAIERCAAMLEVMPDDDLFVPWNGELSQQTPVSRAIDAHPRPSRDSVPTDVLTITDVQKRGVRDFARACFDVRGAANGFEPFVNYHITADPSPVYDGDSWFRQELSVGCFLLNLGRKLTGADVNKAYGKMNLTPAEAIDIANKLLAPFPNVTFDSVCYADDHADDMQLEEGGTVDIPATAEAYILGYTQQVLDVKEIYIEGAITNEVTGREYTQDDCWGYQSIQIAINDDGIVGLWWRAPLADGAVLVSDAALLPYSEIVSTLEKMLFVVYDGFGADETKITVDRAQLGLTRIRETGNLEEGLLVPAWAFYGSVAQKTETGASKTNEYAEGRPLLIINAVNGNIIDPYKGY